MSKPENILPTPDRPFKPTGTGTRVEERDTPHESGASPLPIGDGEARGGDNGTQRCRLRSSTLVLPSREHPGERFDIETRPLYTKEELAHLEACGQQVLFAGGSWRPPVEASPEPERLAAGVPAEPDRAPILDTSELTRNVPISLRDYDAWIEGWRPPVHDVWGTLEITFENPTKTKQLTLADNAAWKTLMFSWVVDCMKKYGGPVRLVERMERLEYDTKDCGKIYAMRVCTDCGEGAHIHADGIRCKARTCSVCARDTSSGWRAAMFEYVKHHPLQRIRGRSSRDYFMTTYTGPKEAGFNVQNIRARAKHLLEGQTNVWQKVTRFNPRRADGEYGKYPGRAEDAGAVCNVEVSPTGSVHLHEMRYGAYHRVEDTRQAFQEKCPDSKWIHTTEVGRTCERKGRKFDEEFKASVCEALKYTTKGATGGAEDGKRGEFTHPMLQVLTEVAFACSMRTIRTKGSMRSLKKDAKRKLESVREEFRNAPCDNCGAHSEDGSHWRTEMIHRGTPFIPRGYTKKTKRKRNPQAAA